MKIKRRMATLLHPSETDASKTYTRLVFKNGRQREQRYIWHEGSPVETDGLKS